MAPTTTTTTTTTTTNDIATLLTFLKEAIFKFHKFFVTEVKTEGQKTCQESNDTHQNPAHHLHVMVSL